MRNNIEAVVLAGGLGTRLQSTVPDLPKCMAPVAGRPFIDFVIDHYLDAGVHHFIFALGHLHDVVLDHLATSWTQLSYDYSIENSPLGTGGAILLAMEKVKSDDFIVLNGDTLFTIDPLVLYDHHKSFEASITVALKEMHDFERYGTVQIESNGLVTAFTEKKPCTHGLINGGVYVINQSVFSNLTAQAFSFEKDILEKLVGQQSIYGVASQDYFIDIGVPEDYQLANEQLRPK